VAADLKNICQAATEAEALQALEAFQVRWGRKYPVISRSWRANWD
jgi:putative transposase